MNVNEPPVLCTDNPRNSQRQSNESWIRLGKYFGITKTENINQCPGTYLGFAPSGDGEGLDMRITKSLEYEVDVFVYKK